MKVKSIDLGNIQLMMNKNDNGTYNVLHITKGMCMTFGEFNKTYEDADDIFEYYNDMIMGKDK